jgi:hypothetical protein
MVARFQNRVSFFRREHDALHQCDTRRETNLRARAMTTAAKEFCARHRAILMLSKPKPAREEVAAVSMHVVNNIILPTTTTTLPVASFLLSL